MDTNLFWFSDAQWAKIIPHLPVNQPGPRRQDDRRILSGIMHVLKIGCRWQDCPKEYGPHKTIYNRFSRWSEKGVWQKIFECVAGPSEPPKTIRNLSGHSMRVGAAQDLIKSGMGVLPIMRAGGWKTVNVVARQVENAELDAIMSRFYN